MRTILLCCLLGMDGCSRTCPQIELIPVVGQTFPAGNAPRSGAIFPVCNLKELCLAPEPLCHIGERYKSLGGEPTHHINLHPGEPEDVPAVKKIVKSDLAYTANCNSISGVCFGDTPTCSDHGHFKKGAEYRECEGGWEWSCSDTTRSLQVSENGEKAWCHRGPE